MQRLNELLIKIPNIQQRKRIEKVYNEEYYVLDSEYKEDTENILKIKISGSKQNVYTITLDKYKNTIICDCPDMESFSQRFDSICKHCCFTLLKIGRLFNADLLNTKFISEYDFHTILNRLKQMNTFSIDSDIVNLNLKMKYLGLKKSTISSTSILEESKKTKFDMSEKEISDDDECPICYDYLKSGEVKSCLDCKNFVHLQCIKKWLEMRNTTCVLCRSKCWSTFLTDYKKDNTSSTNSKYLKL